MKQCEATSIGEICEVVGGGTPARSHPEFYGGDIPWLTVKDLKSHEIRFASEHITRKAVDASATRILPSNTVIVATRISVGQVAIGRVPVAINQDLKGLLPRRDVIPEYLAWFLKTQQPTLLSKATGSTVKGISTNVLQTLKINLPSMGEQRRIVALLGRAAEIRRRAEAARAKARAIIPALFLDSFGDPATNPKGWPEISLSNLLLRPLSYGSMISPKADKNSWLDIRVANIREGLIDHTDKKYVDLDPALIDKHMLRDGDIVLARAIGSEQHLGQCALAYPGNERWAYDSHIMRIRVDPDRVSPIWLHALMNTDGGRQRLLRRSRASAIQHNVNTKEVASFSFGLPPLDRQVTFAEQVQRIGGLGWNLDAAAAKAEATAAALSAEVFG